MWLPPNATSTKGISFPSTAFVLFSYQNVPDGGFLLSFYFLLLILANATQTLSIPFIVYVGAVQLWACYQSWLYLSAKCFKNSSQPSSRTLTLFFFQKEDCFQVQNLPWNDKKSVFYKVYLRPWFLLSKCLQLQLWFVGSGRSILEKRKKAIPQWGQNYHKSQIHTRIKMLHVPVFHFERRSPTFPGLLQWTWGMVSVFWKWKVSIVS